MRRLALGLVGAVLALSGAVSAKTSPTIVVSFVSSANVSVVANLAGAKCATTKQLAASCATGQCLANENRALQADLTPTVIDLVSGPVPDWLRQALSNQPIYCAAPPAAGTAATATPVQVTLGELPKSLEINEGIDPLGPTANTLVWGGWQAAPFVGIWAKVGLLLPEDKCTIQHAAGPLPCNVVLAPSAIPGTKLVTITYSGAAVESGSVEFSIHGQAFHARVHACAIKPTAGLPSTLFAGANLQTLELGTSAECMRRMPRRTLLLRKDDVVLRASVEMDDTQQLLRATLVNIPQPIAGGSWRIESLDGLHLGDVMLRASQTPIRVQTANEPASGPPLLGISYDIHELGLNLDAWQDGKSRDGMAVVTGTRYDKYRYIENEASLVVDPELRELATRLKSPSWQPPGAVRTTRRIRCTSVVTSCEDLDERYGIELGCKDPPKPNESAMIDECHQARRPWRVKPHTWENDVWLSEDVWWRNKSQSFQDELGSVKFAVFRQRADALEVAIELVHYDPVAKQDQALFRYYLKLANGARYESVPLPLASALYVECGDPGPRRAQSKARHQPKPKPYQAKPERRQADPAPHQPKSKLPSQPEYEASSQAEAERDRGSKLDRVSNGSTRAVEESDVLSGSCRLHYSPKMLASALKLPPDFGVTDEEEKDGERKDGERKDGEREDEEQNIDILNYYGTQELAVTVRRGEAEETFPFRIEPAVEKNIELRAPRDAKNATGIYVVSAVLKGPSLPAVAWRTPGLGAEAAIGDGLGDLAFHANLRPRGPFGWRWPKIRMFVTLPVSFTGVRFPARPREVTSSTDSPNVQVTKILGGVLIAVEPWNYDTGRNPLPVPIRFATGMNLYDASNGKFVPSWLLGASVTLPIIDLQKGITEDQLGTDVALGFFLEKDVSERDWWSRGNHFLITFGVNLLTLFGSK